MSDFTLDLHRFGTRAVMNAERIIKKIALDMHSRIVYRTPVDTGRLRANNSVALGNNPGTSVMAEDKMGRATVAAGQHALANYQLTDDIVIYNNVEYASDIEFNSRSRQAPAGMFRVTFNEITSHINSYMRSG